MYKGVVVDVLVGLGLMSRCFHAEKANGQLQSFDIHDRRHGGR